jgi:hypothetical protein
MTRRILPSRRARTAASAAALLIVLIVAMWFPNPVGAEEEISIAPDSVVTGAPGSVTNVASTDVPPELVGSSCELKVTAVNGASTHPSNTLIVTTGDTRAVIEDVEAAADGTVIAERTVTIGAKITLAIQLGPEGISSLGFTAGFDCPPVVDAGQTTPTPDPPVLGLQQLPPTPAAEPTVAEPTYTG